MKNRDLERIERGLQGVRLITGDSEKWTYAVAKNMRLVRQEKAVRDDMDRMDADARTALCEELADKDDKGAIIYIATDAKHPDGKPVMRYSLADEARAKLKTLTEKQFEIREAWLKADSAIALHKIRPDVVPSVCTPEMVERILDMIE